MQDVQANLVIVDSELSPAQARNLEEAIKCRVSCTPFINLDRPGPGAILLMEEMS